MEKVFLVTGGSSGIGKAIALHLKANGYRVFGTSRRMIANDPSGLEFIQMDVNNDEAVKAGIQQLIEKTGRLDGVINSAGLGTIGAVEEMPIDTIKEVFETNFYGVLRVCQAVLPIFRAQKSGHIINISSIAGEVSLPFRGFYSASKFAVEAMTEALRMEVKGFGIEVSMIQPGDFNTNIASARKNADLDANSPYAKLIEEMNVLIKKGMDSAPTPEAVGVAALNIVENKKPTLRYPVGAFVEKISIKLRKFLPTKLYEKIIMGHYNMLDDRMYK
ncbi:SDR family oxidoreductase [Persicobacter psychrovividus]|uniref:Short-chain dehydrogenase/reductase n=1 Tax=Persicobacter psychrovividus TaxID=387638 RepID=A0ABM7VCA4_9BACT|nr:short-chain dehydrogenase/reductase [Persicobacter psychrovividus]